MRTSRDGQSKPGANSSLDRMLAKIIETNVSVVGLQLTSWYCYGSIAGTTDRRLQLCLRLFQEQLSEDGQTDNEVDKTGEVISQPPHVKQVSMT